MYSIIPALFLVVVQQSFQHTCVRDSPHSSVTECTEHGELPAALQCVKAHPCMCVV